MNTAVQAPKLSLLLELTVPVVLGVEAGRSMTELLLDVPKAQRPGVQALAFDVFRHKGLGTALFHCLIDRKAPKPYIRGLLLIAIVLLIPDQKQAAYAPFTVVDQAVKACSGHRYQHVKGLVNACLRRFLRDKLSLIEQVKDQPEARWNHPLWWIEHVQLAYPEQYEQILSALAVPAPMTLRVNQRRASVAQVQQALLAQGLESYPVGAHGLVLARPQPVQVLPGFAQGWWSVQDAGAQLAAETLVLKSGMQVLDACAAPGGKTAHLLEANDIKLTALDVSATRLIKVNENLQRLGLSAQLKAADAADLDAWWDGQLFDAILADVPCTASGIVRRHPDIPWLRQPDDIAKTSRLQAQIADALWQTLKPGGQFLYVTCSIFPIEGELQIQAFLERHPNASRHAAPGQLLPVAHADITQQHDGFFYALLTKDS